MTRIRYGIIGFGGIAENRLAREGFGCDRDRFRESAHAELVGATDLNPERRSAVEGLGLRWYGSVEELLGDPLIQAVVIATSNGTHAAIASKAISARKHCFVEKPLATSSRDAALLVDEARRVGVSLAVDHMMCKNAYNQKARELIAAGAIGRICDICLHMEFRFGATSEEAQSWRCSRYEEMGGPIGDVASHCFYMAEYLLGSQIASLRCQYHTRTLPISVEEGATVRFTLENGIIGSIRVSFGEHPRGELGSTSSLGYEVFGDVGVLRGYGTLSQLSGHSDEPIRLRLIQECAHGVNLINPGVITNMYQAMIEEHALSIINQRPMDCSLGVRNLVAIECAHQSARENGADVKLSSASEVVFA